MKVLIIYLRIETLGCSALAVWCVVHCIDLLEVFLNLDSHVQHVQLRTVQNSNFVVNAVSGMAKLSGN